MPLAIRSTDDRALPVRIPLAHALDVARRWVIRRRRPSWRGLRSLFIALFVTGPVLAIVFGIALLVIAVRVTMDQPAVGLWLLIFSPVYSPLLMLAFTLARGLFGFGGAVPDLVRADMLARARCPACNYALIDSEPEPDGCTRCAECGAAWEHRRIGPTATRGPDIVVINWTPPVETK